jgi:hypothetical protein
MAVLLVTPAAASEWQLSTASEREALADVSMQSGVITLTPRAEYKSIRLTITGPDDVVFQETFTESPVMWRVQDAKGKALPDGRYGFELVFVAEGAGDNVESPNLKQDASAESKVVDGSFSIKNGQVDTRYRSNIPSGDPEALRQPMEGPGLKAFDDTILYIESKVAIGIDDSQVPLTALHIQQSAPNGILLEERSGTPAAPGTIEGQWRILGTDTQFTIGHDPNDSNNERENIVIEEGAPQNQLYLDSDGDIGFGVANPSADFHILNSNGQIRIEDPGDSTWDFLEFAGDMYFQLIQTVYGDDPGTKFFIGGNGNIGIGTETPAERLTVFNGVGNASLLFDSAASANFFLDRGNTSSFSRFVFETNGNLKWSLGMTNDGSDNFTLGPFASVSYFFINQVSGRVGFGTKTPAHPLQMASGAYVSAGGVWTNASSRDFKTDIHELSTTDAFEALSGMQPVLFRYKNTDGERHVGFIAEDVPELVATEDRKGLSTMDVVAVLTKVVQEQQATIERLEARLEELEAK